MIRFSAFLVAVALGLLVAGVVTSKLMLVYVAIGVSGIALLALGVGALLKRNELFGQPKSAEPEPVRAEPAAVAYLPPAQPEPQVAPWEAAVPAASAWPTAAQPAPSRAGYLPSDQPLRPQPVQPQPVQAQRPADVPRRSAAFTPRPPTEPPSRAPGVPAPGTWEWRADAPATQPLHEMRRPASSVPAESPQATGSQPPAQAQRPQDQRPPEQRPQEQEPPTESQPSAADQHETGDQPPDERPAADQETQQLPVTASAAPEPAPDPAPAPSDPAPAPSGPVPGSSSTPEPVPSATEPAPSATEPAPSATEPAPATVDLQREVTVVPGVPRYHEPQCLLIRFMGENDLDKMTLGAAREAGCTPCRACLPDQQEANPD